MARTAPVTVVETPEFLPATRKLFSDAQHALLIDYMAANPSSGDLVKGTGGVRKLRWAMPGKGKSSGARVIYFFHDADMPLFALTACAKSDQADLARTTGMNSSASPPCW